MQQMRARRRLMRHALMRLLMPRMRERERKDARLLRRARKHQVAAILLRYARHEY